MRLILLAIIGYFLAYSPAAAGTGGRASLPAGKAKSGLKVNVDTTWVDANGYRPIQVELIPWPATPAPAERWIRVEFTPMHVRGGYGNCAVSDFIEIPQGAASVTATVSVPQREQWNTFTVEFYEDGKHLEDLSYRGTMGNVSGYGWTEASPAMLFIDGDAPARSMRQSHIASLRQAGSKGDSFTLPDVRGLAELYPPPDLSRTGYNPDEPATDLSILDALPGWSKIEILPPGDLPKKWIDYTGIDFVFVSLADLRQLTQQHPKAWQAIRKLIATGPTLVVYDAGAEFQGLAELERLLELPPLSEDAEGSRNRGWSAPKPSDFTRTMAGAQPLYNQNAQQADEVVDESILKAMSELEGKPPRRPSFVWRPVDLGRVAAISAENPFPGRPQEWGWLLNTVDARDWMWHRRHGLSLNRRNLDYWSFLIPGVGLAPVNTFLVLISLFVVVIGPINYWFLVKHGRLYLLLVSVPVGAFLVTMSLFGYALLTDGLGVKARVRSYTEIDQRRGRSVSWSRQSYYAGMAPSRGLQFPETAAVYPIDIQPNGDFNYRRPERQIDWEDGQSLSRGFISARVTSQMMVVQAQETKARIEINESTSPPQATNQLGVEVDFLVVRDSQGRFFTAQNLGEGATAPLAAVKWADAAERLQKALAEARPSNPEGYDPREYNEVLDFGTSRYYWMWGDVDSGLAEPTVTSSILERSLRRVSSVDPDALFPQSYVALVPQSPEVPLGVERAKQMKSLHVVIGKW